MRTLAAVIVAAALASSAVTPVHAEWLYGPICVSTFRLQQAIQNLQDGRRASMKALLDAGFCIWPDETSRFVELGRQEMPGGRRVGSDTFTNVIVTLPSGAKYEGWTSARYIRPDAQ